MKSQEDDDVFSDKNRMATAHSAQFSSQQQKKVSQNWERAEGGFLPQGCTAEEQTLLLFLKTMRRL
jgi:hypothetical protein